MSVQRTHYTAILWGCDVCGTLLCQKQKCPVCALRREVRELRYQLDHHRHSLHVEHDPDISVSQTCEANLPQVPRAVLKEPRG